MKYRSVCRLAIIGVAVWVLVFVCIVIPRYERSKLFGKVLCVVLTTLFSILYTAIWLKILYEDLMNS